MRDSILTEPAEMQGPAPCPMIIAPHWLTTFLVIVLSSISKTIDFVPNGAVRMDCRSLHIVPGAPLVLWLV